MHASDMHTYSWGGGGGGGGGGVQEAEPPKMLEL